MTVRMILGNEESKEIKEETETTREEMIITKGEDIGEAAQDLEVI
jgi:hypothetical protein